MFTDSSKTSRTAAELATLGIFVVSLLLAYGLTISRNSINMTKPIPLAESGLAVSLPTGRAWKTSEQWKPVEGNGFLLPAVVQVGGQPEVLVNWRYSLGAGSATAEERLSDGIAAISVPVEQRGTIEQAGLQFAWAQFRTSDSSPDGFMAVASLPGNASLSLNIEALAQPKLAMQLFEILIPTVECTPPAGLERGRSFVQEFKQNGLYRSLIGELGPSLEDSYLAKAAEEVDSDSDGYIGYSYFTHEFDSTGGQSGRLTGRGITAIIAGRGQAEHHQFTFDNRLQSYTWRSKHRLESAGAEAIWSLELRNGDNLVVSRFLPSGRDTGSEYTFELGEAALPELFMGTAARFMLDRPYDSLSLQVVNSRGMILPAAMSKMAPGDLPTEKDSEIAYGIAIKFTHGHGTGQKLYYNSDKELITRTDAAGRLLWKPVSVDKLLKSVSPRQGEAIRRLIAPATKI